jgi:hypothetical protein
MRGPSTDIHQLVCNTTPEEQCLSSANGPRFAINDRLHFSLDHRDRAESATCPACANAQAAPKAVMSSAVVRRKWRKVGLLQRRIRGLAEVLRGS